jgi:hypothetical protein
MLSGMRIFLCTLLLLATAVYGYKLFGRYEPIGTWTPLSSDADALQVTDQLNAQLHGQIAGQLNDSELGGSNPIAELVHYTDSEFGFSMAIPEGWRKIVLAENDNKSIVPELGYAVGFEARRQGNDDRFAEYILVEVLPGADSGLLESTIGQRELMTVRGQLVPFEKLYIDGGSDQRAELDLVVFQYELNALGYTVDFYAIGEPANEALLFDAFQILLRTYTPGNKPFTVS